MIKIIDVGSIPKRNTQGKNSRINDIEKFLASGADACEVLLWNNESPASVASSFQNAIKKREHYEDMLYVIVRAGRVFLVRWPGKRVPHAK